MKRFDVFKIDLKEAAKGVTAFKDLLTSNQWLSESGHIYPLFAKNMHLSALLGFYNSYITIPDMVGTEFTLQGDFRCDLVVGQRTKRRFCVVEFEDAREFSIFAKDKKAHRQYADRFEHGFSQIVDWCYKLEDMKKSNDCEDIFETREPRYVGLLVAGRSATLTAPERRRFDWRSDNVSVNGNPIFCITFDDLFEHVYERLNLR